MSKKRKKGAVTSGQKKTIVPKPVATPVIQKSAEIKKAATTTAKQKTAETINVSFAFNRQNYILLLTGIAFILIGFLLMIGGGSDDPNVFNEEIFNFRRITLAPILILIGYVIEIFAIMRKPND